MMRDTPYRNFTPRCLSLIHSNVLTLLLLLLLLLLQGWGQNKRVYIYIYHYPWKYMSLWGVKTFLGCTFQSNSIHFADGTSDNSNTNQFMIMNLIKLNTTLINVREDRKRLIRWTKVSIWQKRYYLLLLLFNSSWVGEW